jgi:hypothetical protein
MVQLASDAVRETRAIKLIVLDRDGVINHDSDQFIKAPDEWRPIPGSLEAVRGSTRPGSASSSQPTSPASAAASSTSPR